MRLSRERTDTLFRLHATGLGITGIEALEAPFTYRVTMKGTEYLAVVLSHSWEYWEHRLQLRAPRLSLVICSKHDTCLPVHTLELGSSGYHFVPKELPKDVDPRSPKRTWRTALVFTGALLSGDQQAFDALEKMHPSSRKRYQRKMKGLLTKNRQGHPLKVAATLKAKGGYVIAPR